METEFYGDGQHNGGVYNSGNNNPYIYTYQNPIKYIDPNGKQTKGSQERHDDNDMSQVVTIRGGKYYKNTTNTWAIFKNKVNSWFGGDRDYWVEKKPYDFEDNLMTHRIVNESAGALLGGATGKVGGKLMGPLLGKLYISTPYGKAYQALTQMAIAARNKVSSGAKLYRVGTLGRSQAAEAQFWSLENPLTNINAYAKKYGIPVDNIKNADFIEVGTLKPGSSFITRPAPAAPGSPAGSGGGIEVVTPSNAVKLESFSTLKK